MHSHTNFFLFRSCFNTLESWDLMSTRSHSEPEDQIRAEKASCCSGKWSIGLRCLKGKLKASNERSGLFGQLPRISQRGTEEKRRGEGWRGGVWERPVDFCYAQSVLMSAGVLIHFWLETISLNTVAKHFPSKSRQPHSFRIRKSFARSAGPWW